MQCDNKHSIATLPFNRKHQDECLATVHTFKCRQISRSTKARRPFFTTCMQNENKQKKTLTEYDAATASYYGPFPYEKQLPISQVYFAYLRGSSNCSPLSLDKLPPVKNTTHFILPRMRVWPRVGEKKLRKRLARRTAFSGIKSVAFSRICEA